MARAPRRPTRGGKANPGKAATGRRGVNALAIVVFLLVAAAGGGIAWLSLTYEAPILPGMPGNDLVIALDGDGPAAARPLRDVPPKPPRPAADGDGHAAPAGDAHAAKPADAGHGDQAHPPAAPAAPEPAAQAPAAQAPAAQDHAPANTGHADTAPQDTASQGTAPQATAPQESGAAEKPAADSRAATADHGTPAPQQHAAVPAPTDHGTPAPAGQPQRQPVGDRQAMQLQVTQPRPGVKPRVAVVLTGLGLSKAQTTAAIQALPANITFAFSPYGSDLQAWADQARAAGHEVLLELPMEPLGFPNDDPGPHTLLTSLPASENIERLTWVLDRFTGYVGVTSQHGGRFTTQPDALGPVMAELKKRGLLFLDTHASPDTVAAEMAGKAGLAHASNDVFLNEPTAARATLQAGLSELEQRARDNGSAVGVGYPFPVTMELLTGWARSLEERGVELLPLSALARLPEAQ